MKQDKKITLKEMIRELSEEKKGFQEKLNKNLNRIAEIDSYLNSIYEKEDSDFKVFSPRNVENVYREQIEKAKQEKYALENENQNFYRQVNRIDHYTENLQSVLDEENLQQNVAASIAGSSNQSSLSSDLSLKSLDIQEKDRQRIARDLHDTSLQNLAHLIHRIELSSMYIDKDPIQAKLELMSVNKSLKTTIEDIRNTIFDLRPMSFDDLGFADMLEDFLRKIQDRYKIPVTSRIDDIPVMADAATNSKEYMEEQTLLISLYRVIRECSLNAMEHSGCQTLFVDVKKDTFNKCIKIEIKDDGIGFDVEEVLATMPNHYGLKIMKERVELLGGSIAFDSVKNEGTDIKITVPLRR